MTYLLIALICIFSNGILFSSKFNNGVIVKFIVGIFSLFFLFLLAESIWDDADAAWRKLKLSEQLVSDLKSENTVPNITKKARKSTDSFSPDWIEIKDIKFINNFDYKVFENKFVPLAFQVHVHKKAIGLASSCSFKAQVFDEKTGNISEYLREGRDTFEDVYLLLYYTEESFFNDYKNKGTRLLTMSTWATKASIAGAFYTHTAIMYEISKDTGICLTPSCGNRLGKRFCKKFL